MDSSDRLNDTIADLRSSIGNATPKTGVASPDGLPYLDLLTFLIAVASALYTRSQRNVARDALRTANEANAIAVGAQSAANALAKKSAEMQDSLAQYNTGCADPARRFLAELSAFPVQLRSNIERQNFSTADASSKWSDLRSSLALVKEYMRREMRNNTISPQSFQSCYDGEAYDLLVRYGSELVVSVVDGRLELLEKFDTAVRRYDAVIAECLTQGRSMILDRSFGVPRTT